MSPLDDTQAQLDRESFDDRFELDYRLMAICFLGLVALAFGDDLVSCLELILMVTAWLSLRKHPLFWRV